MRQRTASVRVRAAAQTGVLRRGMDDRRSTGYTRWMKQRTAHRLLRSVETISGVDRPAQSVAKACRYLVRYKAVDRLLRGAWIGHPTHPLLVTVPIGSWVGSVLFQLSPARRQTGHDLVVLGLVATPAAVLTGLADFPELTKRQRRVALVHAGANILSATSFLVSLRLRQRRSDRAAMAWSLVGLSAVAAGGALGGHLAYAQGAGVHRWQR